MFFKKALLFRPWCVSCDSHKAQAQAKKKDGNCNENELEGIEATAEAHSLHIEKHAKYGWTITMPAPKAEAWIRENWGEDKINASCLPVEGTTKGGSKKSINRSIKYVCPCCGTIIRATREVNVICGDCGEVFGRE